MRRKGKQRDTREYPARPVVGVGGVVIREERALLIRQGHPPLEGGWSIPGGTLELGESLEQGVRREIEEETGLRVKVGELVELFERIFRDDEGRIQYHFVIADYLCEPEGEEARAGGDAVDVAWAGEEEFAKYGLTETATRVLKEALALRRGKATGAKKIN
jgi:8-oxo-dGTP diphosphatase